MEKEPKMQVYEVGYILVPSIPEENVGGEVTSLKDMLTNNGATFIADEYPKMMELAYEMTRAIANKKQKFTNGYFGWVKFEMSREGIVAAKADLDKNESIIRFLITKTVRENTMSPKRTYTKEGTIKRKTATKSDEPALPINEETIDKDIEALVVE
jgi:ribosomal protein S6